MDGQVPEHLGADGGVGLHNLKLLGGEAPWLIEDLFVNGDFADIVKGGGGGDEGDLRPGKAIFLGVLGEMPQKHCGKKIYMAHVQPAFTVAEFHNVAENIDHQATALFFFVDLVGYQVDELFLLGVEKDGIDHPPVDDEGVEGAADKIGDPQLVGALDIIWVGLGGNHDDGDFFNPSGAVHFVQHAEAVHHRHHNIQKDKGKLGFVKADHLHRLHAVFRLEYIVFAPQHFFQNSPVHLRIVGHQDTGILPWLSHNKERHLLKVIGSFIRLPQKHSHFIYYKEKLPPKQWGKREKRKSVSRFQELFQVFSKGLEKVAEKPPVSLFLGKVFGQNS